MTTNLPIKLEHLPNNLPLDGAVRIELVYGERDILPLFGCMAVFTLRASTFSNLILIRLTYITTHFNFDWDLATYCVLYG